MQQQYISTPVVYQNTIPQIQSVVPQAQSVVPQVNLAPQIQSVVPQVQEIPVTFKYNFFTQKLIQEKKIFFLF